jgi:hypothetical protein
MSQGKSDYEKWRQNRDLGFLSKFANWKSNLVGALVRGIEISYFGSPLFARLRPNFDLREIIHLVPGLIVKSNNQNYYSLREAKINIRSNLYLIPTGHYLSWNIISHSFLSGSLWNSLRNLDRKRTKQSFSKIVVLPEQKYFYHFLVEELPDILMISEHVEDVIVLTSTSQPKFVRDYLNWLNVRVSYLSYDLVNGSEIYLPIRRKANLTNFVKDVATKELEHRKVKSRLIVSREDNPRANSVIEQELARLLVLYGFEMFYPSKCDVLEQANKFLNSEAIIGIHGGGLANIIYCREKTKVFEIFTHPYRNVCFQDICEDFGFDYLASDGLPNATELINWVVRPSH